MRFYFEAPRHEAGFVWLKTGYSTAIEVTSGLGSERTRGEFHIHSAPTHLEDQMIVCRKAVAQFIKEGTGKKGQFIATFDNSIEPWKGDFVTVPPKMK